MRSILAVLTALLLFPSWAFGSTPIVPQNSAKGFPVSLFVESYDKTILQGRTTAFTFKEALQKLAEDNSIELTLSQSGSNSKIYSVNHIKNSHFKENDGWYGYVRRNDRILDPVEFLDLTLEADDVLTLYYGAPDKTRILSDFDMNIKTGTAHFTASAEYTEWVGDSGGWTKSTDTRYIPNVKVHLLIPGGIRQILNTDENGSVSTTLPRLGIYKYYAEGYVFNHVPNIVRTPDSYFLYGVKNENQLTRGEAAAFIVNSFNPSPKLAENSFTDVSPLTPYYKEIGKAASAGLISGYEDGTFRPEEPITLLQFCIMMSGLYPDLAHWEEIPEVPSWAWEPLNKLLESGVLVGVPLNWDEPVSKATLMKIYGA